MAGVETLSFVVDVPMSAGDRIFVSLNDASDSVSEAKRDMMRSINSRYSQLSQGTVEAMWDVMMQPSVFLSPSTLEVRPGNNVPLTDDMSTDLVLDGGLRLISHEPEPQPCKEQKRPEVKLILPAIGEEFAALDHTVKSYMTTVEGDKGLLGNKSGERIQELHESRDLVQRAAIKLAFARRMLKYGLLPDEALPTGMLETGFSTWMKGIKNTLNEGKPFNTYRKEKLREFYVENNQAAKNLRFGLWPGMFRRIIGIDVRDDLLFYLKYLQGTEVTAPDHRIAFQGRMESELEDDTAVSMLTGIFNPAEHGLRVVGKKAVSAQTKKRTPGNRLR